MWRATGVLGKDGKFKESLKTEAPLTPEEVEQFNAASGAVAQIAQAFPDSDLNVHMVGHIKGEGVGSSLSIAIREVE